MRNYLGNGIPGGTQARKVVTFLARFAAHHSRQVRGPWYEPKLPTVKLTSDEPFADFLESDGRKSPQRKRIDGHHVLVADARG